MKDKIIIALDVSLLKEEEKLIDLLSPHIRIFKVGMELFYSCGTKAIELIKRYDREVFLDLKFYDIPNTVRVSTEIATRFGVFMFNVHACGGADMMKAALEGAEEESQRLGISRPKILGVTVLTSMDSQTLRRIGINRSPAEQVLNLAKMTKDSGLDGVIASPQEIELIRKNLGKNFLIVTPGVRPKEAEIQDQKRITTPREAIDKGADYIVIGRPVIKAKNPEEAISKIIEELIQPQTKSELIKRL